MSHCCPSHCIDDLCVHSDQGLCGAWRCDDPLDPDGEDDGWDDDDEERHWPTADSYLEPMEMTPARQAIIDAAIEHAKTGA